VEEVVSKFYELLMEIKKEKGIDQELLISAIEDALYSAYKKDFGGGKNVKVEFNPQTGEAKIMVSKKVVEEPKAKGTEIPLDEARRINPDAKIGDVINCEVTPDSFGRIATQTAKQVIIQRIREAERDIAYEKFKMKEGTLVSGTIHRLGPKSFIVHVDNQEAVLPFKEKSPKDRLEIGDQVRAYVLGVTKAAKRPQIILSRSFPDFVKSLFEQEVPEIYEGIVKIKSVAREPGSRTKIAVTSSDPKIDCVGTCVGMRGQRVLAVVNELNGEKIDIIEYSDDPKVFIKNALSPAEITRVEVNEEEQSTRVIVPDDQLSLAIGKGGQNVRLAAKLTNWKIDIKKESEVREEEEAAMLKAKERLEGRPAEGKDVSLLPGVGKKLKECLVKTGLSTIEIIATKTPEDLMMVPGVGKKRAESLLSSAKRILEAGNKE
jgi:N utilization substance protein A